MQTKNTRTESAMNWNARNSFLLILAVFGAHTHAKDPSTLSRHFTDLSLHGGAQPFADLTNSRTTEQQKSGKQATVYLYPGDIFNYITNRDKTPLSAIPDAVIISTNTRLDFKTNNPTIQMKLRQRLPIDQQKRIEDTFKSHGPLNDFTDVVTVELNGSSTPRLMCFVATDRPNGGTYEDPYWIDFVVSKENIKIRIEKCLAQLSSKGAKTVITPMVGASQVDLGTGFITDKSRRIALRDRIVKSAEGIIGGLTAHLDKHPESRIREIGIVVYTEDIKRIIPRTQLNDRSFQKSEGPGSYSELRNSLLRTLDMPEFEKGSQ